MKTLWCNVLFPLSVLLLLSCGNNGDAQNWQKDSSRIPSPAIATPDEPLSEYEAEGEAYHLYCDSVFNAGRKYEEQKYALFMKLVYYPAVKNSSLPSENKKFLNKLKYYFKTKNDSIDYFGKLILPVYVTKNQGTHLMLATERSAYDLSNADTLLTKKEREKTYTVIYFGKQQTDTCSLKQYSSQLPDPSFLSYSNAIDKMSQPAMAVPFAVEPEYVQNKKLDKLFREQDNLESGCLGGDQRTEKESFAKLKGVPNMFFVYGKEGAPYKDRMLAMVVDGKFALILWQHAFVDN